MKVKKKKKTVANEYVSNDTDARYFHSSDNSYKVNKGLPDLGGN